LVEEKLEMSRPSGSSKFFSSFNKFKDQISSNIQASDLGSKIKVGLKTAMADAETSLGLSKNRPYRNRNAPVFSIDDESGTCFHIHLTPFLDTCMWKFLRNKFFFRISFQKLKKNV
jgi:hypothetical protein